MPGRKAAALGRSGRRLRAALDKLRKFDAGPRRARRGAAESAREELIEQAADAYWSYVVQREALGLYHNESVVTDYGVPPEVQRRMGPKPRR